MSRTLIVSTPGRVCLLGEHQDYFGLRVITAAFNRSMTLTATRLAEPEFEIYLPDVNELQVFPTTGILPYTSRRDYLRSARNVLYRRGLRWDFGWKVVIHSDVPVGKGVSSSSVLCVAWVQALAALANDPRPLTAEERAEIAFLTEVAEFQEPGGKMDHYATSIGGVLHLDCGPTLPVVNRCPVALEGLVLGDSLEVKDTTGVLSSIKTDVFKAIDGITAKLPSFSLRTADLATVEGALPKKRSLAQKRLLATLTGRDLTHKGLQVLSGATGRIERPLADLMNQHHESIRDGLGVSTPRIEKMRDAALAAGAFGGKIVGSGAGGCIVLLAPGKQEQVIEALKAAGGTGSAISVASGTSYEWREG